MSRTISTAFCFFLLMLLTIPNSFAESWQDTAKQSFENDEYEQTIEIAKERKKDKSSKLGLMLLSFSHLQKYTYNDTKTDKRKYKDYMELLEDSVTANDLNDIYYFIEQNDKPSVVKNAQKLLKTAFKNIEDISETPKLIGFLGSEDKKTRSLTLDAIKRIIKPKRKYIDKGGTLRDKDIVIMQDEKLIRTLLDLASESKARDVLVMIEQPVLAYIDDYDDAGIAKLESKINQAIAKREKKYPESNWYSAVGKIKSKAE